MTAASATRKMPVDVEDLVSKWIRVAEAYGAAHARDAVALAWRHRAVGSPSVLLSAAVSTSLFASLQQANTSTLAKWILGSLSMASACLAALITFYDFAEKGAKHRVASEEYLAVARALEIARTSIARMAPDEWRALLEGYSQRLEAIGARVELPRGMRSAAAGVTLGMNPRAPAPDEPCDERSGFSYELAAVHALVAERTGRG
jgi:hypothetical protein